MKVSFEVDKTALQAKLDKIGPRTHDELVTRFRALASDIAGQSKQIAAAHIHTQGKNPGVYVASIQGGVIEAADRVTGYVRSGQPQENAGGDLIPLDILLEYGHRIRARAASNLSAHADAFVQAYPALKPAFENARGAIERAVQDVVAKTAGA